jgi:hypothetical protein
VIQILVYVSDMEHPINIVAQEIIEGAEESGIGRSISFKDVKGREGMVPLNQRKLRRSS